MDLAGVVLLEDMSNSVEDGFGSSEEMVSASERVLGKSISVHDGEHLVDLGVVVGGSVVHDGVEVMNESVVDDKLLHITGVHLYVSF
jgi:hypothetical protein